MFKLILEFYTKYFTWTLLVSSFIAAAFIMTHVDLDSIFYVEVSESLIQVLGDSPKKFLDLSNLKVVILLVGLLFIFCLFLGTLVAKINNIVNICVSSILIKTWLAVYTSSKLIINLGFIKILRGITETEKQAFVDSLNSDVIQYWRELPLEIQKIVSPDIFKATTINYLNSLQKISPSETVVTSNFFEIFGNYLWENKFTIFLGIVSIIVVVALNGKINSINEKVNNVDENVNEKVNDVNEKVNNVNENVNERVNDVNEKVNSVNERVNNVYENVNNEINIRENTFYQLTEATAELNSALRSTGESLEYITDANDGLRKVVGTLAVDLSATAESLEHMTAAHAGLRHVVGTHAVALRAVGESLENLTANTELLQKVILKKLNETTVEMVAAFDVTLIINIIIITMKKLITKK